MKTKVSFFSGMGLHLTGSSLYGPISMRICQRDGSGVVVRKTICCWNGHHDHLTWHRVIFSSGDMWKDSSMSPLFLLTLKNSSRESLPHWRMLPKTCCSVFGTSLITDLTCAESQAALILNICENYEIGYRIYKFLFFFFFEMLNIKLMMFNIKFLQFH